MTYCIDKSLELSDLIVYLKAQLEFVDPNKPYYKEATNIALDTFSRAKERVRRGDYLPRVILEAMVGFDCIIMEMKYKN